MRPDLTSPENFANVVREHQALVFRTLTRLAGSGPHVEDLAQEAFLRLFRALPHFRGEATVSTYLYRIVVNVAQDEWKRRRCERRHLAPEPLCGDAEALTPTAWLENLPGDPLAGAHARTPEQILSGAELQASVDAALLALPEIERAVLVLYHQEEVSYEGISIALGLPLNTVRTHLHRGRKRLGEAIRKGPIPSATPAAAPPHPTKIKSSSLLPQAALAGKR